MSGQQAAADLRAALAYEGFLGRGGEDVQGGAGRAAGGW